MKIQKWKCLALALVCAAATSLGRASAQDCPGPGGDTGVVNVSQSPGKGEGEPSLSVNPLDPNDLIVGANQVQPAHRELPVSLQGVVDTSMWVSNDGGCTWEGDRLNRGEVGNVMNPLSSVVEGMPPEFEDVGNLVSADQHSIWDGEGTVFYEVGQLHNPVAPLDERALLWRSNDQGETWEGPIVAYSSVRDRPPPDSAYGPTYLAVDRPWFAVDRSGGPRDGTLYLIFETSPFTEGLPPEVYLTKSTDKGDTWSPLVRVDQGLYETQFNPRQFPVVDAGGTLYVVYDVAPPTVTVLPGGQLAPIEFHVARSDDGGETFDYVRVDDDVHRIESPDEALPTYVETIPALAADPTHPGRLAVAWPEKLGEENSRIMLRYTLDGGDTWTERIDVPDDPASEDNQHDHVELAYAPDGRLFVLWRDRRCCGGGFDDSFQIWARVFEPDENGNLEPGAAVEFTDAPQAPTTGERGSLGIPAEFLGFAVNEQSVMAAWDQPAGDLPDIVFRRVPLSRFQATP